MTTTPLFGPQNSTNRCRNRWTLNSAIEFAGNSGMDWRTAKRIEQRKLNQQDRKETTSMETQFTSQLTFPNPRVLISFALCAAGLLLALAPMSSAVAGDNAIAELSQSVPEQPLGRWRVTGNLVTARHDHTATLLPNGKVLVAGGYNDAGTQLASAELYDPATGTWTATGSMHTGRGNHTATLLANGQGLVAGGDPLPGGSAELYDPASESWTATGSMGTARDYLKLTLLPDGKVLVAGGYNFGALSSAELYDPATGSWTATASLRPVRYEHTATLLRNGRVLVSGGYNFRDGALASAELYKSAPQVLDIE
jgi:hypothetical protein